jgi:hypothetical protein
MATTSTPLYTREFGSRPFVVFGGWCVLAILIAGIAIKTGLWLVLIGSVAALGAGVLGLLAATTRLDVTPGRVRRRTRLGEKEYDASSLSLSRQGTDVFVLAPTANSKKVICAFGDPNTDEVTAAFASAGVAVVAPETPEASEPPEAGPS